MPSFEAFLGPHAYAQLACSSHTIVPVPPSLGTSVCTSSTPTPSKAESADRRRRRKRPTRTSRAGEGLDRVHYVPARPRPLGEHGGEPHGLRFTRTFRISRIAAVVHGQKAHVQTFPGHHRLFRSSTNGFMRSLWTTLNIGRDRIKILRRDLEIFTPRP